MYGIDDNGIHADERQRAAAYRASHRAHTLTMALAFVGMIVMRVLHEEVASLALGCLILVGVISYGLLVDREGWDEHVTETLKSNAGLKRSAMRSNILQSAAIGILLGGISYLADGASLESALLGAAFFAVAMSVFWWWKLR